MHTRTIKVRNEMQKKPLRRLKQTLKLFGGVKRWKIESFSVAHSLSYEDLDVPVYKLGAFSVDSRSNFQLNSTEIY